MFLINQIDLSQSKCDNEVSKYHGQKKPPRQKKVLLHHNL